MGVDSADWPYTYFSREEMACKCGCGGTPRHEFMLWLDELRGLYANPIHVSSGFRCPAYNALIALTGRNGPHTLGLAADILVYGGHVHKLMKLALAKGATGIGLHQKGDYRHRYLHVDIIPVTDNDHPRPWIWTY